MDQGFFHLETLIHYKSLFLRFIPQTEPWASDQCTRSYLEKTWSTNNKMIINQIHFIDVIEKNFLVTNSKLMKGNRDEARAERAKLLLFIYQRKETGWRKHSNIHNAKIARSVQTRCLQLLTQKRKRNQFMKFLK